MKREEKFRTCLFGGYNKEDVQSYIASLEQEIERLAAVETTAELLEKSVNELLEKQKEGKKRMRQVGSVEVPSEAFMSVLKMN